MTCLLDTHFLIWITSGAKRTRRYPWLNHYEPWGVSAISFLEIQLLTESGKLDLRSPQFTETVLSDARFAVDEVPFVALIQRSLQLSWCRDPFDRLIAAHSLARRVPLCSVDSVMLENHKLLVPELR
jgi:PIN domain nuclease of toxin-antitoxin system